MTYKAFHSPVFILIFLISVSTWLFLMLSHLVPILSLCLKALITSLRLQAVYNLSNTYLDTKDIKLLLFLYSFRSIVFHAQSLSNILTYIGLWSEICCFYKNLTFIHSCSKPYVIIMSMLVFFYPPNPCLVQSLASWNFHPNVWTSYLQFLYLLSWIEVLTSIYRILAPWYYISHFLIYSKTLFHLFLLFSFWQW